MNDQDQLKTCPKCEVERPSGDTECACGHKFETRPVKKSYTLNETIAIAKAQKSFHCYLLLFILIGVFSVLTIKSVPGEIILVFDFIKVVIVIYTLYFFYRLLTALKVKAPVWWAVGMFFLWAVGMFFAQLSLHVMLLCALVHRSQQATTAIKAKGFKVGLLGANISEMEARTTTETSQDSVRA